jgi:hypothetical protein
MTWSIRPSASHRVPRSPRAAAPPGRCARQRDRERGDHRPATQHRHTELVDARAGARRPQTLHVTTRTSISLRFSRGTSVLPRHNGCVSGAGAIGLDCCSRRREGNHRADLPDLRS